MQNTALFGGWFVVGVKHGALSILAETTAWHDAWRHHDFVL